MNHMKSDHLLVAEAADLLRVSVPAIHGLFRKRLLTKVVVRGVHRVLVRRDEVEALLAREPARDTVRA
jgi:hypothetical protein